MNRLYVASQEKTVENNILPVKYICMYMRVCACIYMGVCVYEKSKRKKCLFTQK